LSQVEFLEEPALDVSQLKRIPLFADVDDEALLKVSTFAVAEEFPEGHVLVKEGGFSNDFYAIEEGTAVVEREGEKLADLAAGDIFGEQGLFEREVRSATVTATSPIKVIKIEHWELSRMRKAMPETIDHLQSLVDERSS
jgi:CRP-like cAMP-binding protein